ncbi:DUF6491 family protein [Rhodanobacter sp. C03]|uniref:DUF6491 family protein n=1 Tax=Rhodanobacter sp. C03 TaxID=1945858 RepID=UPI0009870947|nr:DUF6491 family protein [Rhodanobacter sp. C03]OOG60332.1 hypothetical protein B0E48_01595 [Rhodanobacter sp. C03]
MKFMHLFSGLLVAGLLASCSSVPYAQRQSQRQAQYLAAAGAPVRSFRFFSPLYSWEALNDQQLVVYARPNQAWLLDVDGCPNLTFANAIGLTSSFNEVSVRFDRVLTGRNNYPCTITQIRPVDVSHLRAAQQAQRKIDEKPREVPAGGQ